LQPACRKLGLPVIGWHSFRHTHATLLGEVGECYGRPWRSLGTRT
jgi:hypothetical protein